MRKFLLIWIGQLASLLGSEMTNFAITIWAWQVTGQATPLSLILFFVQTPRVIASLFAGVLVDRYSRKLLMIIGDLVAGISTIALLLLFLSNNLQIWHLYCTAAVNSLFGFVQGLAYSASLSLLVPPQQYNRATALNSVQMSGAFILAPALAGGLYPVIGLKGILIIDLVTFFMAIATLSIVAIPQPDRDNSNRQNITNIKQELSFGWRYLLKHRRLLAILGFLLITNFIDSFNFAILPAMVLARSNNDPTVWGRLLTTFGIGGVLGAATMSIWNLPKRRINGLLLGNAVWKGGLVLLSVTQSMVGKLIAAVVSGFCSPFPNSSNQGIWMSQVKPEIQGRVFAARDLIAGIATPLGAAIAGVLVDNYFEPAMQTNSLLAQLFGGIFGSETGAGMACAIALFSAVGVIISLVGYAFIDPFKASKT
ncbi:MFS transporter [Pleurocapsa sp. CCALA 161]|uniref:MFS transporter n=1 Tax=Pleurocapsa sp. CCALA 161 TaxID=2107688 RepID=UPI000D07E2A7|nr:MFS transporter [Pleurocapsa sp. CCALA 161]PSB09521.1 MFS transporter [Pleurocapsa sp. CCALA 161]